MEARQSWQNDQDMEIISNKRNYLQPTLFDDGAENS